MIHRDLQTRVGSIKEKNLEFKRKLEEKRKAKALKQKEKSKTDEFAQSTPVDGMYHAYAIPSTCLTCVFSQMFWTQCLTGEQKTFRVRKCSDGLEYQLLSWNSSMCSVSLFIKRLRVVNHVCRFQ